MSEYRTIKVALLGAGVVGAQVARLILEQGDELAARIGARLELAGIAVRDVAARRTADLPAELFTADAERLVLGADIVVEVMGGIEPARTLILQALDKGADVVTANKALIAKHGAQLHAAAERTGAQLSYEAAVAGAIPVIRQLLNSLGGDNITRVLGIVNGSTNYILDSMDSSGLSAEAAMQQARELGFLEADPTLDVEGFDAAQKAVILARIAFHTDLPEEAVYREGITKITAADIAAAKRADRAIKLLAIVEKLAQPDGSEAVSARVYPVLLPREHPLAAVRGGKNAVFVEAESAGELMFYGAGAGGVETASAVLGDLVSSARRFVVGGPGISPSRHAALPALPITEIVTAYHLRLTVAEEPGALAQIARVFADSKVSLARVHQDSDRHAQQASVFIGIAAATEQALQQTVAQLQKLDVVISVDSVIRSELGV